MIRLAVGVRRADARTRAGRGAVVGPGGGRGGRHLRRRGRVRGVRVSGRAAPAGGVGGGRWGARWCRCRVRRSPTTGPSAGASSTRPLRLGGRLEVRPPWIPAADTEINLVIDPGQAFGTGAHATTALCLGILLDLPLPGGDDRSVVDLGCGSGVLAVLAARLGWGPVRALDFDPLAVAATRENAAVNDVVLDEVRQFDLHGPAPVPPARLVLANLLAPLLLAWCDRGVTASTVIASGLLISEADHVGARFAQLGFAETDRRVQGDWAALVLTSLVA